ncbi:hypothetical protein DL767_011345 [Monosporascus sp. MG133]|nr:hypothetical protein DL767_011345 [Monosporascus sp. MG133]
MHLLEEGFSDVSGGRSRNGRCARDEDRCRGDKNRGRGRTCNSRSSCGGSCSGSGTGGDVDRGADPLANHALHKLDVALCDDSLLVQDEGLGELLLRGGDSVDGSRGGAAGG